MPLACGLSAPLCRSSFMFLLRRVFDGGGCWCGGIVKRRLFRSDFIFNKCVVYVPKDNNEFYFGQNLF